MAYRYIHSSSAASSASSSSIRGPQKIRYGRTAIRGVCLNRRSCQMLFVLQGSPVYFQRRTVSLHGKHPLASDPDRPTAILEDVKTLTSWLCQPMCIHSNNRQRCRLQYEVSLLRFRSCIGKISCLHPSFDHTVIDPILHVARVQVQRHILASEFEILFSADFCISSPGHNHVFNQPNGFLVRHLLSGSSEEHLQLGT